MIKRIINFYKRTFWPCEKYARSLGVKIGKGCLIATKFFATEPYLIEIGDNVQITKDVKFFTHSGGWVFRKEIPDFDAFGKIIIKNNVYIGNNVLLLPGIIIGNNVIIGAGAVVTKSIPDGSIVAGNPAKKIGEIDKLRQKMLPYNLGTKGLCFEVKKKVLLSADIKKFLSKPFLK